MSVQEHLDYGKTYDAYWQRADRVGESSGDLTTVAERVATTCGFGMTLDVGSGEGRLVGELLQKGIDAYGLDVSEVVVARSNERWPGRFRQGSVLALPYGDGAFQTVVSTDCMEHLAPGDVPKALLEMYRVSSRFVFLQIATTQDRDNHWHLTVEGRTWWETRCFEAGFRKHPSYYRVNPYEALNTDDWQICVLLEKIPQGAIGRYPMSLLDKGRLLHMDMLRETGRRGDAHCIRYHVAAQYIRPGDVVLDVACGLGYGSHILYQNSQARSVLGVDLSDFGIAYAEANYSVQDAVQFRIGDAQDLSFLPDNSVDFITGFETIEHVPNPDKYLAALQRVLRPSGRLMICAPNDWTDETGRDPNPHHLHVYTWKRLVQECSKLFLLEKGFAQVAGGAIKCHHSPRTWVEVGLHAIPEGGGEWAVLLCMKDPVGGRGIPYIETTWRIPDSPEFSVAAFERDYANPWLVKGMIAIGMRNQSADNLRMMQEQVLDVAPPDSVDFGAALCGQIYGKLAEGHISDTEYACSLARVREYAAMENPSPHQLRWQVSLLFAGAELARRRGNFNDAVALYTACAERDVLPYSPLLGNKTLDALYWLSMMALGRQDHAAARRSLLRGIEEAQRLVSGPWMNICGDAEYPLPFGLAEMAQLLDKASRAAYMLASLDSSVRRPGVLAAEARGYYERMLLWKDHDVQELTNALRKCDSQILSLTQAMAERDGQISSLTQAMVERDATLRCLEQVLRSKSWALTRPLRAIARLVRYGYINEGKKLGILQIARRVGRHLPVPSKLRAKMREALLAKQDPHALVSVRTSEVQRSNLPSTPFVVHPTDPMRPACCALVPELVSVVLPVYNQADLIAESIDSVLGQTYTNFELIVINDGSTDGIEKILQCYLGHPRVRVYSQRNQKLPKALSNGFSYARGEFWTWTSADNIMEPRMLERLVAKLRARPEVAMIYADYYAIDDRGELLQDPKWRLHNRPDLQSGEIHLPRTTKNLNTAQDNFIGPCFMYRGWVGCVFGDYDPQLGVEDYDYWMRINAFFPIRHLGDDSLLYRYRVHDNTLSAQAQEHRIPEKVQRLMSYEKQRAAYYESPLAYVADGSGFAWLQANGVSPASIDAFGSDIGNDALVVINSETAEKNLSTLLRSLQAVAVILKQGNSRYHKLRRLFSSGHCVVLAEDRVSAERVRLVSSFCPVLDAMSGMAPVAIHAFAKNLLFIRATRNAEEMQRESPHIILAPRNHHVVLQVDSFTQGGMENVVIDLGLSLQTNGYRVTIANFGKSADASAKAKDRGLQVVSFSANLNDDAYLSWLRENKVDLVNAHYSIHGAAACHEAGIPFIQTVHNSYVWLDPIQISKYREADRHTTQYICVSMTAARYADVVLGLDVSKMRVVPNGIAPGAIDAANFATNRASLRSAWGVGARAPVFLNVASIMATKAQLPLVKAFARVVEKIPEARLVLLGAVMEVPYQAAIEKAVHELGLQKNVLCAGYDREVARYYHASDIFVLPSYWEGWSLSLGEAIANGLACVITDVGSAYEFEGLDNVEIVDPPFDDITTLNYRNLRDFVYGVDVNFKSRLADAMIKAASLRRAAVNISLAEQLDRNCAYTAYAESFNEIIRMGKR